MSLPRWCCVDRCRKMVAWVIDVVVEDERQRGDAMLMLLT